jgi:type I restriction enzyme, S subunit
MVELGDVIEFFDSKRVPLSSMDRSMRQGSFPYYGASGIIDWIDGYIFDGRYLLVAEDGENLNSRKLPIAFFANGPFWVNNHAHIVRGRVGVLDDVFLQQWFAQADIGGYVTGTAQPKLSQASMKRIKLPLPPFPTQRKIAAVLSAYDDLSENNNRRIRLLEEMAQRIYREWFVDFSYPGHDDVAHVNSELGPIPQGWSVRHLEHVANVSRGLSWDRDQEVASGGLPIITIPNVQKRLRLDGMTRLEGINDSQVEKFSLTYGDTVLVGSNGNPERVGQAVWIARGVEVLFASFLMRVRPDQSLIGSALLHMQLKDPRLTTAWRSTAIGSTSLRNIRLSTLKASPVLLPEARVHARGEQQLRQILDLQDSSERQLSLLRTTRDLLLPGLISGEIDVSDIEIDTSSVLVA